MKVNYNKLIKMINNMKPEAIEIGKKNGIYWNESKWVTCITSDTFDTYEEARQDLLNKLSQYKSVKVIDGNKGVKYVRVDSGWHLYDYTIHAHNIAEVIGEEEAYNPLTKKTYMRQITKHVVYASLTFEIKFNKENNKYDFTQCKGYAEFKALEDKYFNKEEV